jgi:acetylornithine deacetylase
MKANASATTVTERILHLVTQREDALVALTQQLVAFDTTTRSHDAEPARDEAALQRFLATRLEGLGAEVDLWEPEAASIPDAPQLPNGATFHGRPQMIARIPGTGGGKTVVLNGHIDVVSAEPRSQWTNDPFDAFVDGRRLVGRGTCDMKGGIAAMVIAMEVLQEAGIELVGDVIINTVTDEEINGAGTVASLARGLQADYGIVLEPSDLRICTANRGILAGRMAFTGRPGHADIPQPHWKNGGAVNAIEEALPALVAIQQLRESWARDFGSSGDLPPGNIVPTTIKGGEWMVTYPSSCEFELDITYLPAQTSADGTGAEVRREIERAVLEAAPDREWAQLHPVVFDWYTDLPPAALEDDSPLVVRVAEAADRLGLPAATMAHPSWTDAASLTHAGIPSLVFGPTATRPDGSPTLHTLDEYVDIDDLVKVTQMLTLSLVALTAS